MTYSDFLNTIFRLISPEALIKNILSTIFIIIGIVLAKALSGALVKYAVKKVEDDDPESTNAAGQRAHTLGSLVRNILNIVIYGISFVMLLDAWGTNITPILTGAGILGLAIGFGTQSLVRDMVTGFFILFENQFNVNDKVKVANIEGKVMTMGIRTTTLKTEDGQIITIPNSHITTVAKYPKKS